MLQATAAMDAALDSCYGSLHSSAWPTTFVIRLYDADPSAGGDELPSDGGYSAVTISNNGTVWPSSSGGIKTSRDIDFGSSSDAWGAVASWVGIHHPDTDDLFERIQLSGRIRVSEADTTVTFSITVTQGERNRSGIALGVVTPPVAPAPSPLLARRMPIVTETLPFPTLTDGRPTG